MQLIEQDNHSIERSYFQVSENPVGDGYIEVDSGGICKMASFVYNNIRYKNEMMNGNET